MSGLTQLRLGAFCAAAYGALVVSGVVHHFQRTGNLRALVRGIASPGLWIVLVIVIVVAWGLWQRRAWAWWLGVAAAGYQLFRIGSSYVQSSAFGRQPSASMLVSVTLLAVFLVLLLQRKARLAASR